MLGHGNIESVEQIRKESTSNITDTQSCTINVLKNDTNGDSLYTQSKDGLYINSNEKTGSRAVSEGEKFSSVYKTLKETDEESMKKYDSIARNISALAALLDEKLPMPKTNKKGAVTDKALQESRDQLAGNCTVISFLYNKLIMSIDMVQESASNDDVELAQTLAVLKEACQEEAATFQDQVSQYQSYLIAHPEEQSKGGSTWLDALEFVRTDIYDIDSGDYAINQDMSGASSEIFHVTNEKTRENLWFLKENRVPPADDGQLVDELIETHSFNAISPYKTPEIREHFQNFFVRKPQKQKDQFIIAINDLTEKHSDYKNFLKYLVKALKESGDQDNINFANFLTKLNSDEKQDMSNLMDRFLRKAITRLNATENKNSAKIDYGKNLNKRNVATSRLAHLFGIDDLYCTSRLACIRSNGLLIKGSVMENAEGGSFFQYANIQKSMSFSSTAMTEIAIILVMDAICGQTDRHYDNMKATITKGDVKHLKCIDNNLSFGHKTYKSYKYDDGKFHFKGNVKPVGDELIKALPTKFVNRIYNMRLEALELLLCDVLDKKEISSLWGRIKGVQEHIAENYNVNFEERKKEINEGNYKDQILEPTSEMESDDTLRMLISLKDYVYLSKNDMITIPYFMLPTPQEFDKAIDQRRKQLQKGKKDETVSLSIPSVDIMKKRIKEIP